MIIENQRYAIELMGGQDLESVIEIYNSNEHFLINHTGLKRVSRQWLEEEYQNMKSMDFATCKVTDKASKKIIAICDFKVQNSATKPIQNVHQVPLKNSPKSPFQIALPLTFLPNVVEQVNVSISRSAR